jgi:hypothetical protein
MLKKRTHRRTNPVSAQVLLRSNGSIGADWISDSSLGNGPQT